MISAYEADLLTMFLDERTIQFTRVEKEEPMITFAEWRAQGARGTFIWRNIYKDTICEFTYTFYDYTFERPGEYRTWEGYHVEEMPLPHGHKGGWFNYRLLTPAMKFPPGGWTEVMAHYGLTDETLGATSLQELLLYERNF